MRAAAWTTVLAVMLAGCASGEPVQAWQKRALALPEMRLGATAGEGDIERHVYGSREAAVGGDRAGGGGCGCR